MPSAIGYVPGTVFILYLIKYTHDFVASGTFDNMTLVIFIDVINLGGIALVEFEMYMITLVLLKWHWIIQYNYPMFTDWIFCIVSIS